MAALLAWEDVRFGHGDVDVLSDLTLSLGPGDVVALLGPSGSGKSSLVRLALGLASPAAGRVFIKGRTVTEGGRIVVPPEERGLGVVFQDLALWPHLTVRGNLAFALDARGVARAEREDRITEALRGVGLGGKELRHPAELSGGERQRVAIARALVLRPHAILLDEPLSNLDAPLKRDLLALFRDLFRQHGSTVLYVTHDLREAAALCKRIAVLERGRIVQEANIDTLRIKPASPFIQELIEDLDGRDLEKGGRPP